MVAAGHQVQTGGSHAEPAVVHKLQADFVATAGIVPDNLLVGLLIRMVVQWMPSSRPPMLQRVLHTNSLFQQEVVSKRHHKGSTTFLRCKLPRPHQPQGQGQRPAFQTICHSRNLRCNTARPLEQRRQL